MSNEYNKKPPEKLYIVSWRDEDQYYFRTYVYYGQAINFFQSKAALSPKIIEYCKEETLGG